MTLIFFIYLQQVPVPWALDQVLPECQINEATSLLNAILEAVIFKKYTEGKDPEGNDSIFKNKCDLIILPITKDFHIHCPLKGSEYMYYPVITKK